MLSGRSNRAMYMKGQHTIPSDTVCYPAKLAHGHMIDLLEQGVDAIFYPSMTYNFDEGLSENCFNCPVVAYYPELIKANIIEVEPLVIGDHFSLNHREFFKKRIHSILKHWIPNLSQTEVNHATDKAYLAFTAFRTELLLAGEQALDFARKNDRKVIVVAGRPYHIDPEISHGIDKLLTSLGFVVLTEDTVPLKLENTPRNVLNQWTYHARMYAAADFVGTQADMELVQLVSFGCGLDAVTSDEVRDILRLQGRLYTQLKIDEINNLGAAKIRMRSLQAAMEEGSVGSAH